MAFLREYDFRESESQLVEYFYLDSCDSKPAIIIRINVNTLSFTLQRLRYVVTQGMILDEVRHLFDLLEMPYWKSFVRTCSIDYRTRNGDLFV